MPGTSSPAPGPLPTAIIAPETSWRPAAPSGARRWTLSFERQSAPSPDPLTGWTLSAEPLSQIRIAFPDLQAALQFAERKGWRTRVLDTPLARPPLPFAPRRSSGASQQADQPGREGEHR